ncbi:hypothetical protein ScPMuIL_006203 [Solemya velum]
MSPFSLVLVPGFILTLAAAQDYHAMGTAGVGGSHSGGGFSGSSGGGMGAVGSHGGVGGHGAWADMVAWGTWWRGWSRWAWRDRRSRLAWRYRRNGRCAAWGIGSSLGADGSDGWEQSDDFYTEDDD